MAPASERASSAVEEVENAIRSAIEYTRTLMSDLAPPVMDELGFEEIDTGKIIESFARHLLHGFDGWRNGGFAEAAKHYPCMKKSWVEFLGEKPDPVTERVE